MEEPGCSSRSTVIIEVAGRRSLALLDSGSTSNFVSSRAVASYKPLGDTYATQADPNAQLPILGKAEIQFTIGGLQCTQQFLVVPRLSTPFVFGDPWFRDQGVILDFQRGCFHFGKEKRTTMYFRRGSPTAPLPALDVSTIRHQFPDKHKEAFLTTLRAFPDVFTDSHKSTTGATQHKLELTEGARPFRLPPYRCSYTKKEFIAREVEKMLAEGVIEASRSPYSSPIVLVEKKDGAKRFCVDYRRLNQQTVDESSALPIIHETLRDLSQATVFSSLDLRSGYWQIPMEKGSRPLTAFTTPDGATYQFRVMPFGLKNAPATFQKLMTQEVLPGYLRKFALVYLDDVIVYSNSWEEHLRHLHLVFERLRLHNLRLSPEKCHLGATTIDYLGHRITPGGVEPLPNHVNSLCDASRPSNKKQLRSFLGLCNWLRGFIPRCAEVLTPLTDLLRGQKQFKWTAEAENAFLEIKQLLSRPLQLRRPDFTQPFVLQTDASGKGIAAVLYQEPGRKIIAFASAKLSPTEQRYHANEQECLAVVWAMRFFRPYLEDRRFTLRTDSRALLWLDTMKDRNAKLTRWALLLQEYKFDVQHVPGEQNELPDFLSRQPGHEPTTPAGHTADVDRMFLPPSAEQEPKNVRPHIACVEFPGLADDLKDSQRRNPHSQNLIRTLDGINEAGPANPAEARVAAQYLVHDGLLWRRHPDGNRLIVPQDMHDQVLHAYHDASTAGHPGAEETTRVILRKYWWLGVEEDVARHVRDCWACSSLKRGPLQERAPLRPRAPTQPWEVLAVDLMGPYVKTRDNNRFVFVVTDLFSRWVEAFPAATSSAPKIINILESEVFPRYGYPRAILSDNGPQFTSANWDSALRRWGCHHWTTPIYHPQANPAERRIQEIKKCIRIQLQGINPTTWDRHINRALFNVRSRRNAATRETPAALLLGYELPRPGEWFLEGPQDGQQPAAGRAERRRRAHRNEHRYRQRYAGAVPPPRRFLPRQLVMERAHVATPFGPRWIGPHMVIEEAGPTTYWIRRHQTAEPSKVHINDLRLAPPPHRHPPAQPEPAP